MTASSGGRPLVVAGASVRAFAVSAARVGWCVHAADLFGDHDLRALAREVATISPYPAGLPAAIAGWPSAPVVYTGALENHPDLLAALAEARPLAGCPAACVRRVRNPDVLGPIVRDAGLCFPETRRDPRGLAADGSWLVKPLASAGGRGIRRWQGGEERESVPAGVVWQQRVAGRSWSAGYLLAGGTARLLAVSRQLVGRGWCHAGPFAYCGSLAVDPGTVAEPVGEQLRRLGDVLATECGLGGLVGVDLVIDQQRRVHVIEVNPRPTASLELVERATGLSLAAAHLAAFGFGPPPDEPRPWRGTWGKAVLFAGRPLVCDEAVVATLCAERPGRSEPGDWPAVADIPMAGQTIPGGGPVCTVFATGDTPPAALGRLHRRLTTLANRLGV
jgi:predicted ATP-grasp superfamily ATP-dependent carboligase